MLNPLEMQAYIQAIAARADIEVVWEYEQDAPRTDGKIIWLPAITANVSEDQYATLKHYVVHEVGHVRFTDFEVCKGNPTITEGIFGAIINLVEDLRIEKKGSEEFLGDRINSGNVQSARIEEIGRGIKQRMLRPGPDSEMLKQAAPLLNWSHKHWSNMYPAVAGSARHFEDACASDPTAKKYADKFEAGDYDAAFKNINSTADAIKLSEKILREVYDLDPDEERNKAEQQRKASAKDKEKGEGEGKQGKGKMGKGDGGKREEEAWVDFSSVMPDPHEQPGATRTALHITYDTERLRSAGSYNPAMKEDYRVWPRGSTLRRQHCSRHDAEWHLTKMRVVMRRTNPNFAHKVRTILQVRAKDRVEYGKKQGKLHQGSLHRLTIKDAPHYAERVFKKRIINDVLDSCVFLLVDQSGSMGGDKFTHAAVAAAMMNEVIGNVLHIPVFVASFTDFNRSPTGNGELSNIFIHREWKDQLLNNDKLLKSFANAANIGMSSNTDGDAIMWAYNKIAGQKQKRKLIIVFSDGSPAGGGRGDVDWYTKHVIESIEKETPVNIVGIGLMDGSVKEFYKEHYVINKIDTLEEALLHTIEGKLK